MLVQSVNMNAGLILTSFDSFCMERHIQTDEGCSKSAISFAFQFRSNGNAHSSNTILGFARFMLRPRALGESRLFI